MYRRPLAGPGVRGYGWAEMIGPATTSWEAATRRGARLGHMVEAHERIGSTSDRARELLDAGGPEGVAIVAEEQLAGRGRMGRTWTSPAGVNLMVSLGLRPRLPADGAWGLGPATALAARRACMSVAPVDLKWPNDLVAGDGGKLGGLLVEVASEAQRVRQAVVGVGINANWPPEEMPSELQGIATSLSAVAGRSIDRVELLRRLLEALEDELVGLEAGRSPLPRYREACVTLGRAVIVDTPSGRIEGFAVELDDRGALVVDAGGSRISVASGEVARVRPGVPS